MFFRLALLSVSESLKKNKKNKELIKILDSTKLEYPISRVYFAKKGYCNADKKYIEGIKLHVLMDYSNNIIEDFIETGANINDSLVADTLLKNLKWGILLIDKGYFKLERFVQLDKKGITFVIPLKSNSKFRTQRIEEIKCNKLGYERIITKKIIMFENGLQCQLIDIDGFQIMTNNLEIEYTKVVELYEKRWNIETLFKSFKQHININKPLFRNFNSILTFICVGMITSMILGKFCMDKKLSLRKAYNIIGRTIQSYLVFSINEAKIQNEVI